LVNKKGAEESGLKEGTPITYRAGDQPNNAFSLHVINPGEVAATGGTSGVVYALTDKLQSKEHQRINHFAHINYSKESPIVGKLLCINGAGIQYRWMKNNTGATSYKEMNQLAAKQDIGSDGLLIYPFGNGAERMLNNQNINARYLNLNLNQHDLGSMYRATLEGIAFSFVYGIKFIEHDNFNLSLIKAGNDNLFQSAVFSQTIATLVGKEIQLYNTTGAIGAARASSANAEDLDSFIKMSSKNDYFKSYTPEKDSSKYEMAFSNWTNELEKMIN
jgi:xylulokinase